MSGTADELHSSRTSPTHTTLSYPILLWEKKRHYSAWRPTSLKDVAGAGGLPTPANLTYMARLKDGKVVKVKERA